MDDHTPSSTPWYESNLLWGSSALASAIILTVVAAMKHDLGWLLWLAWPFFGVSVWSLARQTREVWLISVMGILLVGAGLWGLSNWLGKDQTVKTELSPSLEGQPTSTPTRTPAQPLSESANGKPAPTPHGTSPQVECPDNKGFCNAAPNFGSQFVDNSQHFGAQRPAPNVLGLKVTKIPGRKDISPQEGPHSLNPGVQLMFRVDHIFPNPTFLVHCDRPCVATQGLSGGTNGSSHSLPTNFPNIAAIQLGTIGPLTTDNLVFVTVRSLDKNEISVSTVEGYVEPNPAQ